MATSKPKPTPRTPQTQAQTQAQGDDTYRVVMELRSALAGHGITLPSLGRDFGVPPLVILGNCNTATARALTAALRDG